MSFRELLRHLRGPVIVLLDNSSTHQGRPLEQLLRQHPRLQIERFPSYAPELNPMKGFGRWRNVSWPTVAPMNWRELVEDVIYSINRICAFNSEIERLYRPIRITFFFARMHCILLA